MYHLDRESYRFLLISLKYWSNRKLMILCIAMCSLGICLVHITYYLLITSSRHMVVCQRPRKCEKIKIRVGTPVCYLRDRSSSRFQPIITQKLWCLFLPILHILISPYTVPYISNLRGIAPAVPEIRASETCRILFVFFFFLAPNTKSRVTYVLVHR